MNWMNPSKNKTLIDVACGTGDLAKLFLDLTDKEIKKIIKEDRLYFNEQRLRDIEYDSELDIFFILFEYTPSIGILKYSG